MRNLAGWLLLLIFCASCAKERILVPDYPVNYLITVQEFNLKATNGVLLVPNEGVAGLIVYRNLQGGFLAYDRCSTVNPEQKNAVVIEAGNLTALDTKSGAKYFLSDGSPAKAPAVISLKQYRVILMGGNTIQVVN